MTGRVVRTTRRQVLRAGGIVLAVIAWGAFAIPYLQGGWFATSDTSCDGGELRANSFGVWYLVIAAAVWVSPFVVIAVRKRSWIIGAGAVVAACVAIGVISMPITNPGEFCF